MSNMESRISRNTVSRRTFLTLTGGVTSALWLAACASPQAPTVAPVAVDDQPGAQPDTRYGGPTLLARQQEIESLDPHLASNPNGAIWISLYDTFLQHELLNPDTGEFQITGGLAEAWEDDGDLAWILYLRPGVTFHDGSEWNADVAKWNLDRMRDHPASVARDILVDVESVEIVDDMTVRVHLANPSASFPYLMTAPGSAGRTRIVSMEAMESLGEDTFSRNPVGTGPFELVDWIPDSHLLARRNENYWRVGDDDDQLPYLNEIRFDITQDYTVVALRLRSEDMHISDTAGRDLEAVLADDKLTYWAFPWQARIIALGLNAQSGVFSDNVTLRRAFAHAVPYDSLAPLLGGPDAFRATHFWPVGGLGYDDSLPFYDYDPDLAQALLAEAGYPDGITLKTVSNVRDARDAEAIQSAVREHGFNMELNMVDSPTWREITLSGENWDVSTMTRGWTADPDAQSRQLLTTGAGNFVRSDNMEIEELMLQARRTFGLEERHELYKRIQELIYEDALWLYVYGVPSNITYNNRLGGVITQWDNSAIDYARIYWAG